MESFLTVVVVLVLIMCLAALGTPRGGPRFGRYVPTDLEVRRWNRPRSLRDMGPADERLIVALVAAALFVGILFLWSV